MTETNPYAGLFLICRATQLCSLPLDKVSEIMRPMPLDTIADLPPFVLGAAIIRGVVVPVVSLARLLGNDDAAAPAHPPSAGTSRFISLKLGARRAALAVDQVIGIRNVDAGNMHDMAPLLERMEHGTIVDVTTLDSELLLVLQASRLVPDAVWQSWAGQGAGS